MKKIKLMAGLILGFSHPANASPLSEVVVTIAPLHSLVQSVMGDTGDAKLLIQSSNTPHGHQLKPSLIATLQNAKIVFYIGDNLETGLHRSLENVPKTVKKIPMTTQYGISKYDIREGGGWEKHDHSTHQGSKDAGSNELETDHHHDHTDPTDPHIWLDPDNAIVMAKVIARELSKIYPENRSVFKKNALALILDVETRDQDIRTLLSSVKTIPFVVFHDGYQYFEKHYDLTAVGTIVQDPSIPASVKRVKELRQKITSSGAVCIFREPQFSDKLARVVAEGTNVKLATIDPLGVNLKPGAGLYSMLLKNVAGSLSACLSQ